MKKKVMFVIELMIFIAWSNKIIFFPLLFIMPSQGSH